MGKIQQKAKETQKNDALSRIKRTEFYAESVRTLFDKCVNEILAAKKTLPELGEGEMYSFDGDTMAYQKKVEELLRRLASAATLAVENGVSVEWDKANSAADSLLQTCFGNKAMEDVHFSAWRKRNTDAMHSFQKRTDDGGMKLSDKIWKTTRQLREEMEIAMTLGIGEGESAADMSRKVRKYLNNPDLMFRRFRYKVGEKVVEEYDEEGNVVGTHKESVYGRKWKKKVKDENGKVRWIDYDKDSFKVGRGNYKSSARNAMRVTRTETNIAYRASDQTRWSQMDFVLGMHIEPSRSHPKSDICDKLAGDYPKDFVFEGWHPQCFCVMTPILMDEDEMVKISEAFEKGVEYMPKIKRITTYPQGFKDWIVSHKQDIEESHKNGTDPYFVKHNFGTIKDILKPKATALEVAEARHASRTGEDIERIKRNALKRRKSIDVAKQYLSEFEGVSGVDTSKLEQAYKTANWDSVRKAALELSKLKRATIESAIKASKEMEGVVGVNTDLKSVWEGGKLSEVQKFTETLNETKTELQKLKFVQDPLDAAKSASLEDLKVLDASIQKKIDSWSQLPLANQKKKLEFEIYEYLGTDKYGAQTKFPKTWQISQNAYIKQLNNVNHSIEWESINTKFAELSKFKTKSKIYADGITALKDAISKDDKDAANQIIISLDSTKKKLEGITAKRQAAKFGGLPDGVGSQFVYDDDAYTQQRKDAAVWAMHPSEIDKIIRTKTGEVWRNATQEERDAAYSYTQSYCCVNEPLRGLTYLGGNTAGTKTIPALTSIISKCSYDRDIWLNRFDTIIALNKFGLNVNNYTESDVKALVGKTGTEGAVWSAGDAKGKGLNGGRNVIINIYCPKGTKMLYAEPFSAFGNGSGHSWDGISQQQTFGSEAEIIIQRNTTFRVTKVETPSENKSGKYYIDVEVVAQDVLPFPYPNGKYPFL